MELSCFSIAPGAAEATMRDRQLRALEELGMTAAIWFGARIEWRWRWRRGSDESWPMTAHGATATAAAAAAAAAIIVE